jgi:hypothetical protein
MRGAPPSQLLGEMRMSLLDEIVEYAKQEVKEGFLLDYYFTDKGDIVGISEQGEFMYWRNENE